MPDQAFVYIEPTLRPGHAVVCPTLRAEDPGFRVVGDLSAAFAEHEWVTHDSSRLEDGFEKVVEEFQCLWGDTGKLPDKI